MKIRIQLFSNDHVGLRHTHDVLVTPDDEVDDVICSAIIKLLRHTWTLEPGDTIKIVEA